MSDSIDLLQIKIEKAKAQLSDETLNAINAIPWKDAILEMRDKRGYSFEQLGDLETETELVLCGLLSPKDYPNEIEKRLHISKAQANELVSEMNMQVFARIREELIKTVERKKTFAKQTLAPETPVQGIFIKPAPTETEKEKMDNVQMFSQHGIEIVPARNAFSLAGGNEKKEVLPMPDAKMATQEKTQEKIQEKQTLPVPEKLELATISTLASGEKVTTPAKIDEVPRPSMLAQKLSATVSIPAVKTEHSLENITKARPLAGTNGENIPTSYPKNADPYRLSPDE